jgi:hypothetical protein
VEWRSWTNCYHIIRVCELLKSNITSELGTILADCWLLKTSVRCVLKALNIRVSRWSEAHYGNIWVKENRLILQKSFDLHPWCEQLCYATVPWFVCIAFCIKCFHVRTCLVR